MAQNNKDKESGRTPKDSGGLLKDLMELTTKKKGGAKVMLSKSRKGKKNKNQDGSQKTELTMKKKHKISVIKATALEDEEKETFENVADSNPVFSKTLIRPGKMRWKGDDKEEQETLRKKKDDDTDKKLKPKTSVRQKVTDVKNNKSDDLLIKIEKLEKENDELKKKLKDVQTVLKNQGKEEPKEVVCVKCKNKMNARDSSSISISKSIRSIIIQPDEHAKVAYSVLSIMKKNQVLDAVLDFKSNKILFTFFREGDKPTDEIANLVETAMTRGLKYLINCCDQIDDVIDNDLRNFICSPSAKKVLLKTLFENPELVPDMWGGGPILIKRRKEKEDATNNNNHHS